MIKKITFVFAFVIVLSSLVAFSVYQGVFNINKVNMQVVNGTKNLDKNSIVKVGQKSLKEIIGRPIFMFSLQDAYKTLSKDPRIQSLTLKRKFPSQVNIEITPKNVVASMMSFKVGLHSLTGEGDILPVQLSLQNNDLPILRGVNFHKDKKLRLHVIQLLKDIPEKGLFSQQNISEIRYDKKNGFIIYLSSHDSLIKLGKKDFQKKSSHIERAMSYLESQKLEGRVIDARYSKKVVVKLRNEP